MTYRMTGVLLAGLASAPMVAGAAAVYSEPFNSAAFEGSLALSATSTTDSGSSDLWRYTNYYNIVNNDGWAFQPGAYYAVQATSSGADTSPFNGGVLLNESAQAGLSSTTSPLAAMTTSFATVIGQQYSVSFTYGGDNRPNQEYAVDAYVNGVNMFEQTGTDGAAGSLNNTPYTTSFVFTATGTTTRLGFGQNSQGVQAGSQASPIIDNVVVNAVPLPAGLPLLLCGLGGLGLLARRRVSN